MQKKVHQGRVAEAREAVGAYDTLGAADTLRPDPSGGPADARIIARECNAGRSPLPDSQYRHGRRWLARLPKANLATDALVRERELCR